MAFYAYNASREAVQSIGRTDKIRSDGVGAYYAYDATHEAVQPVNGLALGATGEFTDNAMRGIVRTRPPVFVGFEWAARNTDTTWKRPSSSDELTLIPVSDAELREAKRRAGGHDVQMVGVFSKTSPTLAQSEGVFSGTRYAFSEQVALYAKYDGNAVPVPVFLTLAHLREPEDRDGGSGKLADSAAMLSGVLVYVIALPARDGRRSLPPITEALSRVQRGGRAPVMPGAPPAPVTPNVLTLSGAAPRGFHQPGLLGVSTGTLVTGGLIVLLSGAALVAASMASGKA